jgi:hypothetical protein
MLAAIKLEYLHSFAVHMNLCHAWFLQGFPQLKTLRLFTDNFGAASAIAQLTELTRLELLPESSKKQPLSAAEQSELGSALATLSNLQCLQFDHAPFGPVTQVLSQLTALTELWLYEHGSGPNPGSLTLPSCVKLNFTRGLDLKLGAEDLARIEAPRLRHLDLRSGWLALKPSDLDALRRLCRGVLSASSNLLLDLQHLWSKEDTVALMTVLSQGWQPSAEARQASIKELSWCLAIRNAHLSCRCLSLLPKGLTYMYLR